MTTYNHNIIVWQKWSDPFGEDDTDEIMTSLDDMNNQYEDYYDEDDKNKDENIEHKPKIIKSKQHIRVMATPMGIIPVTENTASGKIFNFWTGHTNFDITPKVASIIEQADGVEALDIFTRYRFRIAIGKAFKDSYVMQNINETVYEHLEQ